MERKCIESHGRSTAILYSPTAVICDVQSALDLLAQVRFDTKADQVVINKESFCEDFFKLSTGLAGEILQKFVNYGLRLAIVGDFTQYTSKPLRDFIYESNQGTHCYFVESETEALAKLNGTAE